MKDGGLETATRSLGVAVATLVISACGLFEPSPNGETLSQSSGFVRHEFDEMIDVIQSSLDSLVGQSGVDDAA